MSQRNISYEKDCANPYGAYVQASNDTDPTNTNAPRIVDAVYLRPALNVQGGHKLMHLATGDLIRRRKVTEIPATDSVINAVEKLVEREGITSFKIDTHHGVRTTETEFAGVHENDDDEAHEEEHDEDYDNDQEMDQEEIDDVVLENDRVIIENVNKDEEEEEEEPIGHAPPPLRRSTRTKKVCW